MKTKIIIDKKYMIILIKNNKELKKVIKECFQDCVIDK